MIPFKKFHLEILVTASLNLTIKIHNIKYHHYVVRRKLEEFYQEGCATSDDVKVLRDEDLFIISPCIQDQTFVKWPNYRLASFLRDKNSEQKVRSQRKIFLSFTSLMLFQALAFLKTLAVEFLIESQRFMRNRKSLTITSNHQEYPGIHLALNYGELSHLLNHA